MTEPPHITQGRTTPATHLYLTSAGAAEAILEDHPFAPYITFQPSAYDLGITSDPDHEPEAGQ